MKFKLFSQVSLTEDIPEYGLKKGLSRTYGDKLILSKQGRMPYAPTKKEFVPL